MSKPPANKEYTGTCLIGVVGPETDYSECRDSIYAMTRRNGDELRFIRATKGYEARQLHLNNFISSKHDFLLLLDHDQTFPEDTLERLRGHKLPYVSGYYMRRRISPLLPVWFDYPAANKLPYMPWTSDPERGKLHKLGASGWGCLLVHREVVEAVHPLLKGEPEIIEDDMDVWPYDLAEIMGAIRGLEALNQSQPDPANLYPALAAHIQTLRREIRPLRCKKDCVGSDVRFPFFAREAGYTLWGDPDVRAGHTLLYNLTPDDYSRSTTEEARDFIRKNIGAELAADRQAIWAARERIEGKQKRGGR